MDNLTAQKYWDEIKDLATEAREQGADDVYDYVHESVDQHQWIIYTFYNMQVLQHTSNANAYFDNYGELDTKDFSSCMAKLAWAGMVQDVMDAVQAMNDDEPTAVRS